MKEMKETQAVCSCSASWPDVDMVQNLVVGHVESSEEGTCLQDFVGAEEFNIWESILSSSPAVR